MHTNNPPVIKAHFKSSNTFYVVGIGHILTGALLDGAIAPGNCIVVTTDQTETIFRITAVETIDYMTAGTSETALILEITGDDCNGADSLKLIAGKTVDVLER